MSSIFKCLVELNNHKYIVCIDCNYNEITFNTFYYEIQNQTKQNISHETHEFQIFDNDFKEYVLISSDKQLINNLSKIKIIPKIDSNVENVIKNVEVLSVCTPEESQKSAKITINDKSDKTEITFNTNQKPNNNDLNDIYSKTSEFNNYIKNETKSKIENNEKVVNKELNNCMIETVVKPLKPELVMDCIPIDENETNSQSNKITDYLNLKNYRGFHSLTLTQLSFETRVEKIRDKSTIVLKMRSNDTKAFEKLLKIMVKNKNHFYNNPSNDLMYCQKWLIVSNQMISSSFMLWSDQKCRDSFLGSINWYKKALEYIPNYEIASRVYPLFESIHSLDLKHFLKYENFVTICELREKFCLKSEQSSQTMTKNSFINQSYYSEMSYNSKNDKLFNSFSAHKSQEYKCFVSKVSNLSDFDIKSFHILVEMIDKIDIQFGREIETFWSLVSNEMKSKGYHDFEAKKCENNFLNYVCDYYSQALIHCNDYKTATTIYPLFEFIHTLDLKPILSYHSFIKIQNFRAKYYHKFESFKTGYKRNS